MTEYRKNLSSGRLRGDTIVEVIICIAVLGVVMAVAYVSTTHSLQVGTDAGNRNRAVGFAQQQIEQIKYYDQTNVLSAKLAGISPGQHFCYDPKLDVIIALGSQQYCTVCTFTNGAVDQYINPGSGSCNPSDQSIYSIYLTYDAANVFSANARWVAPNGSGFGDLSLYYKLPT